MGLEPASAIPSVFDYAINLYFKSILVKNNKSVNWAKKAAPGVEAASVLITDFVYSSGATTILTKGLLVISEPNVMVT